ncbi:hypothetical protein D9M72_589850 [compost metagenome]
MSDDNAVDEADETAAQERGNEADQDRARSVRRHDGGHAGKGDGGADREIEVARGEAEHHRAGDDADGDDRLQQAQHVALGQEVRNRQRHDGERNRKNDDETLFAEKKFFQRSHDG